MAKEKKGEMTVEKATKDFKYAYEKKSKLIEREKEDFLFAAGKQWSDEDLAKLNKAKIKPITDNRIAPNIFLLTGLERQNRSEFKAFPEGEEDGLKADIASSLFKDVIRKSNFLYKSSEQFKDGIICGESHLELYLDYTDSLINGKALWCKADGNTLFWDPAAREYDLSDARFVYKIKKDVDREDLINTYGGDKGKAKKVKDALEELAKGKLDLNLLAGEGTHSQPRDYPKTGSSTPLDTEKEGCFDLVERYYKKWVENIFVGDKQGGEIKLYEDKASAEKFVADYQSKIKAEQDAFAASVKQGAEAHVAQNPALIGHPLESVLAHAQAAGAQLPPPPPEQDPDRFIIIKKLVPEIWCFAFIPGLETPLADERAWCYPEYKGYPFVPYFARYSTAPLTGDDRHLLIQGIVHGVKGAQEKHNKAEMLTIRHLNGTTNSGWLAESGTWTDPSKVEQFGTTPGITLEYNPGKKPPERISPAPLSQGHMQIALDAAESIKAQLGMNSDLMAAQQGGTDSGRAIALRQKQGLLMVQEPFDNHSRSRMLAGKLVLSQLGKIYDTESAMKVLGEAFMKKNFPPPMLANPNDPNATPAPMPDKMGEPMKFDKEMAELAIHEVLAGDLGNYDVSVGEAVASDTQLMAASAELKDIATAYPGVIPPDIIVKHSQLPQGAKNEIIAAIEQARAAAAAAAQAGLTHGAQAPAK